MLHGREISAKLRDNISNAHWYMKTKQYLEIIREKKLVLEKEFQSNSTNVTTKFISTKMNTTNSSLIPLSGEFQLKWLMFLN